MASFIRLILIIIAGIVGAGLLEPPFVSWLEGEGYYDNFSKIFGFVLTWLGQLAGMPAFPWFATGIIGVTIGVWLDWGARKYDRNRTTNGDKFKALYPDISALRNDYWNGLKDSDGNVDFTRVNHTTVRKTKALYARLRKVGMKPPTYDEDNAIDYNIGHDGFLATIEEFAKEGLLKEAKREAKLEIRKFKDLAAKH